MSDGSCYEHSTPSRNWFQQKENNYWNNVPSQQVCDPNRILEVSEEFWNECIKNEMMHRWCDNFEGGSRGQVLGRDLNVRILGWWYLNFYSR